MLVMGVELLDGRGVGLVLGEDFGQVGVYLCDPPGEVGLGVGLDGAGLDYRRPAAGEVHHAIAGDVQPRVDAEDAKCGSPGHC